MFLFTTELNKNNIYPTPVIGGVGLIKDLKKIQSHSFSKIESQILVIGKTFGHLDQSVFANQLHNLHEGMPPEVNLRNEKNNGEIILKLINLGLVNSVHDVSTGGIILALAEMSISSQIELKFTNQKNYQTYLSIFLVKIKVIYC